MIRRGFLNAAERKELLSLARDGSAEHRIARRANAILLLEVRWPRLFGQISRFDKWNVCRG